MGFLQRPRWYGAPVELGEFFILHRDRHAARCVIRTHQFGWELWLHVGAQAELIQTQVCRTEEDVLTTGERWKAGMMEKGWQSAARQ